MHGEAQPDASLVTIDDVRAAAARIADHLEPTPSARSVVLSELLGADVVLKFENLQFTAAFKERGALNRLLQLTPAERRCGVVAMSAGNHAQAVARHAQRLGIDAAIVMPAATPFSKVQRTEALGARVVLAGADIESAFAEAERIRVAEGRVFVHPFDDPAVIAGQGTIALELFDRHPEIDTIVVPVGGGGLAAGVAVAARALRPDVSVVGAQSERWPGVARALAGEDMPSGGTTIADGIAVGRPGALSTAVIRATGVEIVTVSEPGIEEAVTLLLDIEKVVVEGAGAAGIAAMIEHRARFAGRCVGVVLSGGNVDPLLLSSMLMRGLVRTGRLARLRIDLPDVPGSLGRVTTMLGDIGANVVDVVHNRLSLGVPARVAQIDILIELRDHRHRDEVLSALASNGVAVDVLTDSAAR